MSVLERHIVLPTVRVSRGSVAQFIPYGMVPFLFVISVVLIPGYGSWSSIISLLLLASLLGMASVGQTLAVIVGGIDLSIPAVIGMADVMITVLYGDGWSFWPAAFVVLAVAFVIGAASALLSSLLRVHSLVITLAMGLIVSGAVLTLTHAQSSGTVPDWLTNAVSVIGTAGPIPLPAVVVWWFVASILVIGFLKRTRLGLELYALGANPVAARFALVRMTRAYVVAFSLSAVFAALTGILLAGFSGAADPTVGLPYLFQTISAVVIGGTSLLGGRGGYAKTAIGALIITQLSTLLVGFGFGAGAQQAILGGLIIVLMTVYGRDRHISTRI